MYSFIDPSRADREIRILAWYPAKIQAYATPATYNIDAEPDLSGAPYPLILSSAKIASYFGAHLASYGFVVVGVKGLDTYNPWDENLFEQSMDILFVLDQAASRPLEGLEGMIDAEHVGVMGYSFDGYNALAMSGARVDPEYHLSSCAPAAHWVEFSTSTGASLTTGTDGLWQPMADERIRAVIPMAPERAMLFGERGLAAVDRPTLILVGTADTGCDYNREAVAIFKQIGTPNKALISLRNLRQNEMAWFGVYRKRSDRRQLLDPEMACVSF